jgi:hypothetical protein
VQQVSTSAAGASHPTRELPPKHFLAELPNLYSATTFTSRYHQPDMSEGSEDRDAQIAQLASLTGLDPATVGGVSRIREASTDPSCRQSAT